MKKQRHSQELVCVEKMQAENREKRIESAKRIYYILNELTFKRSDSSRKFLIK